MPEKSKGLPLLECCQEIPCNPCVTACKAGAITKETLTSRPVLHPERCVGCKLCVAACPGQAIFFQILHVVENRCTITFPYEYRPLPVEGQAVTAVNRMGEPVCPATVVAVEERPAYNKTVLVTLEVPEEYRDEVRFLKRLTREERQNGG